jgi:hypothetical protein
VWKKLKGWKEKNLSFAGRATLIKAVAQAIPTYIMSSFLIPKGLCDQMESQISNFWWGSNVDKRKIHWVNWKKTCKAKSKGGMGFKDLRAFNEALLAKQGWRLVTNPTSLVARILKAKCYPNCDFLKARQHHITSYSWQSIHKASWLLKKGCFWNIGNGASINIWTDRWIQPQFGSSICSKKPTDTPLQMVMELMDTENRGWKADIIHQTFYPHEARQICAIPITLSDQEDFLSWYGSRDGTYSVKSGYQAIMDWQNSHQAHSSSTHNQDNPNLKTLWNLHVPPKQLHLIWRILNNAIPVKEKLFKRGIRCVPLCSHCNNHVETIEHTFLECDWVKKVWFASPLTINFEHVKIKKFQDWMEYMIQNSKQEELQIISTILYGTWQARNNREFNGKQLPPTDMLQKAMQILHEFQANQGNKAMSNPMDSVQIRNDTSWSLPPKEALKLNVDAHSMSDGRWGIGLLLRRDDGSCVGAVTRVRLGSECALLAEAMGLQEAVNLVQSWNLHNVIIEMDAQTIVNSAHKQNPNRTIWGRIVSLCAKKMKERNDVTLVWTRRQGNMAAHDLAKWAEHEPNREWIASYPTCISHHIQKDMISVINC